MSKRILVISLASVPADARPFSPLSHGWVQVYAASASPAGPAA
jgi:hypothetical protein